MSGRRTLKDANGTNIGELREKKTPSLHRTYYFGPMNNLMKFKVKGMG